MSQPQNAPTYEGVLKLIQKVTRQTRRTERKFERMSQATAEQMQVQTAETDRKIQATAEQIVATDRKMQATAEQMRIPRQFKKQF